MKKLEVSYLGLKLKNPVVAGSSGLTATVEKIIEHEKAGAGAVVVKSLFEEQINIEAAQEAPGDYPEAYDYIAEYTKANSVARHLDLIREAKEKCRIPVIASISCAGDGEWINFAKEVEKAGADAIELNISLFPDGRDGGGAHIEKQYLDIVARVCGSVSIPVAVKMGRNFSNIPAMAREIYYRGAKGVVMFNRFYEPDIDIDSMKMTTSNIFSSPTDFRSTQRWLGIVSSQVRWLDLAASTGIHNGYAAVKALLAGACTVQLCSAIYQNGEEVISQITEFIESWMEGRGFSRVGDMIGRMNYGSIPDPEVYERTQFMRYFSSHE